MISINFSGDTMAEVARDAVQFAMIVANSAPAAPQTPQIYEHKEVSVTIGLPDENETPGKRTRRSKAQIEADAAAAAKPVDIVAAAIESTATRADAAETVYPAKTFDEVKESLRRVCETDGQGVTAAKELMASFEITRLSLLPEDKWGQFAQAAKDRVGDDKWARFDKAAEAAK